MKSKLMTTQYQYLFQLTQALAGPNLFAEVRQLRGQLIAVFEACVLDPDRLHGHLLAVQQFAGESAREGTLPLAREKLAAGYGLSILTDDELLHLVFSPDALVNL